MLAAAVVVAVALQAPAAAVSKVAPEGSYRQVEDDDEEEDEDDDDDGELGFMERRASFSLNDPLHESIEDDLMPFFLGGILGCVGGQVWLPLLLLDEEPDGYLSEAFVTWLIWAVPLFALYSVAWVLTPVYGLGLLVQLLLCPIALTVGFYIVPVNVANAWDRTARENGMKVTKKKKKKKKNGDDDGEEESLLLDDKRGRFAAATEPMAY